MIQYSTQAYLVRKECLNANGKELKSVVTQKEKKALLKEAATLGISRWVNPILQYPLDPIVLVEGKYDISFMEAAQKALNLHPRYRLASLAALLDDPAKGGLETLLDYVKRNKDAIRTRSQNAKVVVLLDWEAANKLGTFAGIFKPSDAFVALAWDEAHANPILEKTFRGIERFMSTNLVDLADLQCGGVIGKKANGNYSISGEDLAKLKVKAATLVTNGISVNDAQFAKQMLLKLDEVVA
jgi:hypothetical protein